MNQIGLKPVVKYKLLFHKHSMREIIISHKKHQIADEWVLMKFGICDQKLIENLIDWIMILEDSWFASNMFLNVLFSLDSPLLFAY